jgi:hypothetical protein
MAASLSADFGIAAGELEQAIAQSIDPASNNAGMSQAPDLRRYRVLDAGLALLDFSGGVPPSASGFTASLEFVAPSAGLAGVRFESPGLVALSFPESGVPAERGAWFSFAAGPCF